MQRYTSLVGINKTPQTEPIPGEAQVKNNQGGFVYQISDEQRLRRFLIMGSAENTYYVTARKLTRENVEMLLRMIRDFGEHVVETIVEVSTSGVAPKNDPALFALALCIQKGDDKTRTLAKHAVQKVARTATHLFTFVQYATDLGGWSRALRNAVASWYHNHKRLEYQMVKYRQRDGWTHRDVLRLAHVKPHNEEQQALFAWAVGKAESAPGLVDQFKWLQSAQTPKDAAGLIAEHSMTHEMVPTKFLREPIVWEALLKRIPYMALVRNLGRMASIGMLEPFGDSTASIVDKIANIEAIEKSRIHPINLLSAFYVYGRGRSERGKGTWTPISPVQEALEAAFYVSFKNVEPTKKNTLVAVDVSSSMTWGSPVPGIKCLQAAAAMALLTARTEPKVYLAGFAAPNAGGGYFSRRARLATLPSSGLGTILHAARAMGFGGTDCSLPMVHAMDRGWPVESFVIYTDNETAHGSIHPSQALRAYRDKSGIDAKLAVCAMTSTDFSIADPNDPGMLDVVGFDAGAHRIMGDFFRG